MSAAAGSAAGGAAAAGAAAAPKATPVTVKAKYVCGSESRPACHAHALGRLPHLRPMQPRPACTSPLWRPACALALAAGCGSFNELGQRDQVRCRICGYRIFYKVRTDKRESGSAHDCRWGLPADSDRT